MADRTGGATTLARQQRLHLITHILATRRIATQYQLVEAMAEEGYEVSDTTLTVVNRDLTDLGAVRVRAPGAPTIWAIPELIGAETPPDRIVETLRSTVMSISQERDMVLIHTTPTTAETVAAIINAEGLDGVRGAIGSGAMVLVICADATGPHVERALRNLGSLA